MAILTVYTKLLDQTLTGARIIDMGSTRTCQLYAIPREQLSLVFVSKANEVYASEVLFLEYLGIKKALEAGIYSLDENKQIPQKPSIAPDKENDMELFFDEIMFLTKFYGRDVFEPSEVSTQVETNEQPHTFYMDTPKSGVKAALDYYPINNH